MVYKRYNSPFNEPYSQVPCPPEPCENNDKIINSNCNNNCSPKKNTLFGGIGCDDIIIIGLILVLMLDDTDQKDFPLIIALGFLLITGWLN